MSRSGCANPEGGAGGHTSTAGGCARRDAQRTPLNFLGENFPEPDQARENFSLKIICLFVGDKRASCFAAASWATCVWLACVLLGEWRTRGWWGWGWEWNAGDGNEGCLGGAGGRGSCRAVLANRRHAGRLLRFLRAWLLLSGHNWVVDGTLRAQEAWQGTLRCDPDRPEPVCDTGLPCCSSPPSGEVSLHSRYD